MIKLFDENGDISTELFELIDYGLQRTFSFLVIFIFFPFAIIGWLMKKIDKKFKQVETK